MITTSSAKNPLVVTTSPVRSSMATSFLSTSIAWLTQLGRRATTRSRGADGSR